MMSGKKKSIGKKKLEMVQIIKLDKPSKTVIINLTHMLMSIKY